jgi:hypothetical protein
LQNKRLRLQGHFALSQEFKKRETAHAKVVVLALVRCLTLKTAIDAIELSKAA